MPERPAALSLPDRPSGSELLAEARRLLREEILPALQGDQRFKVAMVANAMGMAERELAATRGEDDPETVSALAAGIRAGRHDADSGLHQALLRDAEVRVGLSNPAALAR